MKCKHPRAKRMFINHADWDCLYDCNICTVCGEWMSLGESDETDKRVAIEIRAAEIAATLHDTRVPKLSECEEHGWETHANDDARFPVLCDRNQFQAGYLARVIAETSGGGGGE